MTTLLTLNTGCSTIPLRERADSLFLIHDHLETYYDLKKPSERLLLPFVLTEISGLGMITDHRLLCVEDEKGYVYEYDVKSKEIINSIKFWSPGDFEGVELVNDKIYVLESDGDIFEMDYTDQDKAKATKYENKLNRGNDTEALGYDPVGKRLLIGCKGQEEIKGVDAKGKTVYAFDVTKKELIEEPFFELTAKDMESFFEANRDFDYEEERIKFKPSGIAYNPLDEYYYLLASVGQFLIVLDRSGEIQGTYPIPPYILGQPEGIAFSSDGEMYISSEGRGERGYIVRFSPIQK
ncbi:MAG: SdiA-regulated domain-containing protein [Marinoscillum sp.]